MSLTEEQYLAAWKASIGGKTPEEVSERVSGGTRCPVLREDRERARTKYASECAPRDEIGERIVLLYGSGMTVTEISRMLERPYSTIFDILRMSHPRRRKPT